MQLFFLLIACVNMLIFTALIVSMPIARSLKICNICGIVLCDKTAHFRVDFYCGQPKAHLCNNHAI